MRPNFTALAGSMLQRQLDEELGNLLAPVPQNPFKGARLLLIDDDPTQRLLARDALESFGFCVDEASDGPEGIVKALLAKPDLVILDIVMPELDGFTVCADLRSYESTKSVPILIVTGLDDAISIERGFVNGATDFVSKPVNWKALTLRVKYMLRNAGYSSSQACETLAEPGQAGFPRSAFAVLGKNPAQTNDSKQAFVGEAKNACLGSNRCAALQAEHVPDVRAER